MWCDGIFTLEGRWVKKNINCVTEGNNFIFKFVRYGL